MSITQLNFCVTKFFLCNKIIERWNEKKSLTKKCTVHLVPRCHIVVNFYVPIASVILISTKMISLRSWQVEQRIFFSKNP